MGKIDMYSRRYLNQKLIFADAVNYAVFNGKCVVKAEKLKDEDSRLTQSLLDKLDKSGSARERYRDLLKSACIKSDGRAWYMLFGIENQSRPERAMVLHNLEYDLMTLRSELCKIVFRRLGEKAPTGEMELLARLRPGEKAPPVVTIVVYWGSDKWNAPKSLKELIDCPWPELRRFMPSYRLNLIEPCRLTAARRAKFTTKLGTVLHYAKSLKSERAMKAFIKSASGLGSLTQTETDLLAALGGKAAEEIKAKNKTEGDSNMRTAWDEIVEHAESRGMKKGMRQGRAEGKSEERMAIIRKLAHSLQEAGLANDSGLALMMATFKMSSRQARKYLAEA